MDPAASVLTILDEALKIAKYIQDVHDGHSERKRLRSEVLVVCQVFSGIQDQFEDEGWATDNAWSRATRPLLQPDGVIQQLRETLSSVAERLALPAQDSLKRIEWALKWPFHKDEIKWLTDRIHSLLQVITTTLGQANFEIGRETHANVIQANSGIADIRGIARAQDFQKVLSWISPLDFRAVQESNPKKWQAREIGSSNVQASRRLCMAWFHYSGVMVVQEPARLYSPRPYLKSLRPM